MFKRHWEMVQERHGLFLTGIRFKQVDGTPLELVCRLPGTRVRAERLLGQHWFAKLWEEQKHAFGGPLQGEKWK